MKKALSIILSIMVIINVFLIFDTTVFATEISKKSVSEPEWSLNNGTLSISGTGEISYKTAWNEKKTSIKNIVISGSISKIGRYTFQDFQNLETVTIDCHLKEIEYNAFEDCLKLETVSISNGLTKIGDSAFKRCLNLKKINLPSSLTSIGKYVFEQCEKIQDVTIPSNVEKIGKYAFSGCEALSSLTIQNGVKTIDSYAFEECGALKSLTIPNSVTSIGDFAFDSCYELNSVSLGSGLKNLGNNPFHFCVKLNTISLSNSNNYISVKDGVLFDSNKTLVTYPLTKSNSSYTVPSGTKVIGEYALDYADLKSVYLPDSVEVIEDNAFYFSGVENISFSRNLKEIGRLAFAHCHGIKSLELPDSVNRIGDHAFDYTDISNAVNIGKNITSLGSGPFTNTLVPAFNVDDGNKYYKSEEGVLLSKSGRNLIQYPPKKSDTSYKIPESVIEIGQWAFENNETLSNITLPEYLKGIDYAAFRGAGISEFYFKGNAPDIDETFDSAFRYVTADIYYANGDSTWTSDITTQQYGGNLTWKTWNTPVVVRNYIINNCIATLSKTNYTYDGNEIRPSVTVKDGAVLLSEGKDYSISYSNNISAGTAKAVITGINQYKGTSTLNFTINKAEQKLTAAIDNPTVKIGKTAKISTECYGTPEYSSSNSSIAQVSRMGVVTAKSEGSAVITVSTDGDENHYGSSDTVTVNCEKGKLKNWTSDILSYSFSNSSGASGFNYGNKYQIPYERYEMMFPEGLAVMRYLKDTVNDDGSPSYWGGNCYGMSATSIMFNSDDSTLKLTDYNSNAKYVKDLGIKDKNYNINLNVTELCEAMLLSQYDSRAQEECNSYTNDVDKIINRIKECDNGALPVLIGMYRLGYGGHAVVGYKYEELSSKESRIYIYDCNYPKQTRYIYFYKDSSGKFTGIKNDYGFNNIDMNTYPVLESIWEGRYLHRDTGKNHLIVNSDKFSIIDQSGTTVATMKNNEFTSKSNLIYEAHFYDIQPDDHYIVLPTDKYTIVNGDSDISDFEVTMVDNDNSASVKTDADKVNIFVDDTQDVNIADVDGNSGEYYEVTLNSNVDSESEEVIYSGKCASEELSVATVSENYCSSNYTRSGITVNDNAYNFGDENSINISEDFSVSLSNENYIYDGTAKTPDVYVRSNKDDSLLEENVDYTVVYAGNTDAGTASVIVYGINKYTGKLEKDFSIGSIDISKADVKFGKTSYSYTGTSIEPDFTVSYGSNILEKNKDYTVKLSNNVKGPVAKVTITGINNYKGSIKKNFSIKGYKNSSIKTPKIKATGADNSKKKRKLSVSNSKSVKADGYQFKIFNNNGKCIKNHSTNKSYYKATGISRKKFYSAQVRAYVKNGGSKKYSKWSSKIYFANGTKSTARAMKNGINVKWSKVSGAKNYTVYIAKKGNGFKKYKTVKGTSVTVKKYGKKKLSKKTTYKVKVVAKKSGYCSVNNDVRKVKMK